MSFMIGGRNRTGRREARSSLAAGGTDQFTEGRPQRLVQVAGEGTVQVVVEDEFHHIGEIPSPQASLVDVPILPGPGREKNGGTRRGIYSALVAMLR